MESILDSTKAYIGIPIDSKVFDSAVLSHINTALAYLCQMGVGPQGGFYVENASAVWSDFNVKTSAMLSPARTYVHISAKLGIDPPAASAILDSMNRQKNEIEWRLTELAESQSQDKS